MFSFRAFRFQFKAHGALLFPRGMAGNTFRGAFGQIFRRICGREGEATYARIFEPRSVDGPSGFLHAPRPFVLRPRDLEERHFGRGDTFFLDVHLFDLEEKLLMYFVLAFQQLAQEGLGPARVPVELTEVRGLTLERTPDVAVWSRNSNSIAAVPPLQMDLYPMQGLVDRLRVEFRTPTELKSEGVIAQAPEFAVLLGRVRDRISALSSFYGEPLHFDFKTMGERAKAVKLVDCQTQWEQAQRRSSRTGRQHLLSGFVGWADYAGDLNEFVPWLEAGYWSGVGRQTVWGKGEITVSLYGH